MSDNRDEQPRTSTDDRVLVNAGNASIFAGNFVNEDAWGSRGRGFKSRRPDWSDGFFRLSFGGQLGSQWFPGAGAGQLGGVRLQDAVHGGGVIGEGGPDLVTVDRLGDRCARVPDQVAELSRRTSRVLRMDTTECRSSRAPGAALGEADNRTRAIRTGWRIDAVHAPTSPEVPRARRRVSYLAPAGSGWMVPASG